MNFVAIDFETANGSRDSACAIGAVVVRDGKIVERKYSLINPKVPFQKFCTYIHGITDLAVRKAPTFEDIYPPSSSCWTVSILSPITRASTSPSCAPPVRAGDLSCPSATPFAA